MNRLLCVWAACVLAAPAVAADVGVSVSVGQPGFYGRVDVGASRRRACCTVTRS
jgi:hypothetical protein